MIAFASHRHGRQPQPAHHTESFRVRPLASRTGSRNGQIDESWIGLGIAATGAAVAIDPLTWRRVEIRPTVRVTRTTRTADPDARLVGD